jgi:hypothetical protein
MDQGANLMNRNGLTRLQEVGEFARALLYGHLHTYCLACARPECLSWTACQNGQPLAVRIVIPPDGSDNVDQFSPVKAPSR